MVHLKVVSVCEPVWPLKILIVFCNRSITAKYDNGCDYLLSWVWPSLTQYYIQIYSACISNWCDSLYWSYKWSVFTFYGIILVINFLFHFLVSDVSHLCFFSLSNIFSECFVLVYEMLVFKVHGNRLLRRLLDFWPTNVTTRGYPQRDYEYYVYSWVTSIIFWLFMGPSIWHCKFLVPKAQVIYQTNYTNDVLCVSLSV